MPKRIKEIAEIIKGELVGDGEILIKGINGINEAQTGIRQDPRIKQGM